MANTGAIYPRSKKHAKNKKWRVSYIKGRGKLWFRRTRRVLQTRFVLAQGAKGSVLGTKSLAQSTKVKVLNPKHKT
ncbi:hypothetical protein GCM10008111_19670 [Alishewanella tabrizica]|uniref:50S ribosomal protein L32 n=1 Tax=Alishewanella tabrizica TaxID=671278 RepID=A0ABQ2WNE3_9ALTE|nr:hypothetical protein GCM10008111_19670 [Alishewanella tabrizica]